jgi:hypothetical protein
VPALRAAGADGIVLGSLGFGAGDLKHLQSWLASLGGAA